MITHMGDAGGLDGWLLAIFVDKLAVLMRRHDWMCGRSLGCDEERRIPRFGA